MAFVLDSAFQLVYKFATLMGPMFPPAPTPPAVVPTIPHIPAPPIKLMSPLTVIKTGPGPLMNLAAIQDTPVGALYCAFPTFKAACAGVMVVHPNPAVPTGLAQGVLPPCSCYPKPMAVPADPTLLIKGSPALDMKAQFTCPIAGPGVCMSAVGASTVVNV